ncbi:putative phosphodiesterase [Ereboglobus sp. PH5-10]|uniref:metallophosphoesterase n=1 Tax=Ereboglobus sp. PH5-10 TaxID=2940629 RepID=UPI002406CFEC|nr:metallophosphoesterase [Ereboglobus sp. PH5-10]MDF9826968.1 putative phosphodiesterase [Ereboglobus sp. PH5-10]
MNPKTPRSLHALLLASALALCPLLPAKAVIDAGFETGLPAGVSASRIKIATDTSRAHSGRASLRITSESKGEWSHLTFALDGKLDFSANHEFSVWVYVGPKSRISARMTADDGSGEPYIVVHGAGDIEQDKWCRLSGTVYAGDWRKNDRDFKLVIRVRGTCWIDDLSLVTNSAETHSQVWPRLKDALHAAADKRPSTIAPGGVLVLDARNAALAPDTARDNILLPGIDITSGAPAPSIVPSDSDSLPNRESKIENAIGIPADGMLVFAIDAKDDLDLTGTLQLEPDDDDLRPGLRVTVLSDDTVIAAPGVKAAPWRTKYDAKKRPSPITKDLRGERPPATIPLNHWRMTKGRHYIAVAGPHMRPGGTFARLELRAAARPAEKPLHTFGFLADTHLGFGRITKATAKLNARTAGQLEATLRQLKREGADFAIIAGDMTDNGRRSQFEDLARATKNAGLPVYGCVGNHDTGRDSRADIAATIPHLFPDGPDKTDYAFTRPPLRFIVLDGSHWRAKGGPINPHRVAGIPDQTTVYRADMLDWLRDTLAADTTTPTIVVSHYMFYLRRGISSVSGYNLGKASAMNKELMAVLDAAPNVVATLNGHHHRNAVGHYRGITSIQNPAFASWPNAYRVFRVYADRIEWEVRQMPNRGLIRESANPGMGILWTLSIYDDDLAGTIPLAPRAKQ